MLERRPFLAGLAGLWASAAIRPAWAQSTAGLDIRYGWQADVSGPTDADLYVAPGGSDRADGSAARPLRTIQRGVNLLAARDGGSLAIRGGIYREQVDLDKLRGTAQRPYRIHRYGQEKVTITAAEPLTDWEPCPEDEARALGLSGSGIYVARLSSRSIEHGALGALNLHERGQWRSVAIDRADMSDPEASGDQNTYHTGSFEVDGKERILAIRDARLKDAPESWMEGVEALVYHRPNLVSPMQIAKFNPNRGEIRFAKPGPKIQRAGDPSVMRYALRGASWALSKGTWIARKTGWTTSSVYFKPVDPSALKDGIEVSLRPTCVDFGRARHVELFGLEAVRAAGGDRASGMCIRRAGLDGDAQAGDGLRLVQCRVGETESIGPRGRGALFMRGATDLNLQNVSIEHVRGGFGMFLTGCSDVDARFLNIANVSNSPARFFGLRRAVLAFSLFEDSARDAHANKFNFYEGSDAILVYGVRCRNVGGYATYQKASRIHFAFCDLPCDPNAFNRALVAQNLAPGRKQGGADGSGDPVAGGTFYYWNNTLAAEPAAPEKPNALNLGPEFSSQRHAIFNNILHGGGLPDIYTKKADPRREERSYNRYTGLSFWQTAKFGWQLGPGEKTMPTGAEPQGQGRDMRPELQAEIARLFPGFTHWEVDIDGHRVDWSAAPIGARVRG